MANSRTRCNRRATLVAACTCLLLCVAACTSDAADARGIVGGGRRLLQQAQQPWYNAVLDSTSTQASSQQSWWMDIMTKVATTAQLFEKDSGMPTAAPTAAPTVAPTAAPTAMPTKAPTAKPTKAPTAMPTKAPTVAPTAEPTKEPTTSPTKAPTAAPTTKAPTSSSASQPTSAGTTGSTATITIAEEQASLSAYDLSVQKQATVSTQTAVLPCQSAGDGGTLCGIPIGYEDGTTIVYNRTGVYYLPKTYKSGPLPVLILLHGSGVNGNWMLQSLPFMEMADRHQVIVVAPDSKFDMYWFSPDTANDGYTHDWFHMEACYDWVANQNPQGAVFDKARVSLAGNSRAGYVGPPFCSRSKVVPCDSSTVMHADILAEQMGDKVIPILWTAGIRDPLYGPNTTVANIAKFRAAKPQFTVYYNVWDSGHALDKSQELDYIVEWGANPSFWGTPAPPMGSYRRRLEAAPEEQQH